MEPIDSLVVGQILAREKYVAFIDVLGYSALLVRDAETAFRNPVGPGLVAAHLLSGEKRAPGMRILVPAHMYREFKHDRPADDVSAWLAATHLLDDWPQAEELGEVFDLPWW